MTAAREVGVNSARESRESLESQWWAPWEQVGGCAFLFPYKEGRGHFAGPGGLVMVWPLTAAEGVKPGLPCCHSRHHPEVWGRSEGGRQQCQEDADLCPCFFLSFFMSA